MKIGFIGAGRVGKSLGLYFKSHDLNVLGYYSRTAKSAQDAAILTASREFTTLKALADSSDIIFITVPDQALAEIDRKAAAIIQEYAIKPAITWIHVSGAHPSFCLDSIKKAGCAVGSMHPLQSFSEPVPSAARLSQAWFTIEGTEKAVQAVKTILAKTGGNYSLIEAENKPLYHAGACVISNFLVTLVESGIQCFEASGMGREDVFRAIEPLIDATLSNIREKGTIDALTGPIVRGDFNTVGAHLQALEARLPLELDFYKSLALKTALMLDGKRLTPEQTKKFQRILEEKTHV
ncbi:arogenate dehydrogenase [Oxobacter pfennigii]|uniref:Arogenate dehydrogenase n=1 Tax=Oxobacter pfennigii TaxID=36849 RepID=A0A0N8NTM3_9CLOT|nr:Rossmann-like and DUF2520 domain-containing protein [Oxobacter pfennigii]KPU45232.1 arogenate dehydrogenase [Oxobacter pfennigii]